MSYEAHTPKPMPWGYEQPVAITLSDGTVWEECLKFEKPPTTKELDKAAADREALIEARISEPEPEEQVLDKDEVEKTLREKGYLTVDQKWEDLPEKSETSTLERN